MRSSSLDAEELLLVERRLNDTIDQLVTECVVAYFDRATSELAFQARRDPLTQLLNHQAFTEELEAELDRIYAGEQPHHALTRRLKVTVDACDLPRAPLRALIAANRQDQLVHAYATFADLLAYCELSANPVGRLVLAVLGAATPERVRLSDAICTGLQLTEHWQDVAEDLERGRLYIPLADLGRFGCEPDDLRRRPATAAVRALLAYEVERAREFLDAGAPLVRALRGRPALAVAGFVAGGRAALQAIGRAGYDVSGGPPRASRATYARALAATLAGRRA
jgi:squalene synthase HpnC